MPGESTLEPIQLLNNICEEVREKQKELWILLQDTTKAFNMVNLEMLEKALDRIKILKRMIKLIIYLFREREVRVITENGLINPIKVGTALTGEKQFHLYFEESSMIPYCAKYKKIKNLVTRWNVHGDPIFRYQKK